MTAYVLDLIQENKQLIYMTITVCLLPAIYHDNCRQDLTNPRLKYSLLDVLEDHDPTLTQHVT
jgi:hypothetical protein